MRCYTCLPSIVLLKTCQIKLRLLSIYNNMLKDERRCKKLKGHLFLLWHSLHHAITWLSLYVRTLLAGVLNYMTVALSFGEVMFYVHGNLQPNKKILVVLDLDWWRLYKTLYNPLSGLLKPSIVVQFYFVLYSVLRFQRLFLVRHVVLGQACQTVLCWVTLRMWQNCRGHTLDMGHAYAASNSFVLQIVLYLTEIF